MILFLDSSSVVAIYLQELRRSDVVGALRESADQVVVSVLAYVEARAAFARALRDREREASLSPEAYKAAVEGLDTDWPDYVHVEANQMRIRRAADVAAGYALRAYDAVQLASALDVSRTNEQFLFSTWDSGLAIAATAAGLSLAHEVTT